MVEYHHLELIKETMLKHEATFKHQVRELHRLYNVQKKLMGTLRNDTRGNIELFGPTDTLNISNEGSGIVSGFDLSRLIEEDTSYRDNCDIHSDRTTPTDVELTLSIGPSTSNKQSQNRHHEIGGNESKATIKTNVGNSNTLYNQDSKRPHWLFKDLSLSRA